MADDFGLHIGIEGESQFKNALRDINQTFKVLGSEMALVTSQFDKNDKSVNSLTSRNTVLNKEIDQKKTKIETLRSALQNAALPMAAVAILSEIGDLLPMFITTVYLPHWICAT